VLLPCSRCGKGGVHQVCYDCRVSFHLACGHDCPTPASAVGPAARPPAANPPAAARPPMANPPAAAAGQANQAPTTQSPTAKPQAAVPDAAACGGACGHASAATGGCGCTPQCCGCGKKWGKGGASPAQKLQHYQKNKAHQQWLQPDQAAPTPPSPPAPNPSEVQAASAPIPTPTVACGGRCGHPKASSGGCGCTPKLCGCGKEWGLGVRDSEKEQHYNCNHAHKQWCLHVPKLGASPSLMASWLKPKVQPQPVVGVPIGVHGGPNTYLSTERGR